MTVRKGLGQANILRTNNNTSTGYGVAYADEVSGHRTVANLTALYALNDWQLSASGDNTDNDAIGQLWYVVNADGNGNGCYYQLKDWSKRKEAAGWSIADYTTKAELQDKIDNIATADEEDITTEGDTPQTQVLKLKDRAYDSLNASGKGYKILRKNWQTINGERKNVLTQDMINEPNTIYEIRYDFDLNDEEVIIQKNSILQFNGGSFYNGKVTGINAQITADSYQIFNAVSLEGNWTNLKLYPEWFGAVGDAITDDTASFKKVFTTANNLTSGCSIQMLGKTYILTDELAYYTTDGSHIKPLVIEGVGAHLTVLKSTANNIINIPNGANLIIRNFSLYGNNKNYGLKLGDSDESLGKYVTRCTIDNIAVYKCKVGVFVYGWLNSFTNLNVRYNNIGLIDTATQTTYNNLISERNKDLGVKFSSGTKTVNGGTIEGNGNTGETYFGGLYAEGTIILNGIYFEGNGPADTYEDINPLTGLQNKGFHIKAGDTKNSTLSITGCLFHRGDLLKSKNTIELNKVSLCSIIGSEKCDISKTENTGIVNVNNGLREYDKGELYNDNNKNTWCDINYAFNNISPNAFFEKNQFNNLKQSTSTIYHAPTYLNYYPLSKDGNVYMLQDKVGFVIERNKLNIFSKGTNNSIIGIIVGVLYNFLLGIPDNKITFVFTVTGNKHVNRKYTTVLGTRVYGRANNNNFEQSLSSKSISIDYTNGITYRFYLTVDIQRIKEYVATLGNIETCQVQAALNFASSEIANTDENIEYNNAHIRIESICIYKGAYPSIVTSAETSHTKEYEDMGVIAPRGLFLPKESDIIPIDGDGLLYQQDNCLAVKKSKKDVLYYQNIHVGAERLSTPIKGYSMLDTSIFPPREIWWDGAKWIDSNGNKANSSIGTTALRPTDANIGYLYYDTTLKKYIVWNGTEWTNMDGSSLEEQPA